MNHDKNFNCYQAYIFEHRYDIMAVRAKRDIKAGEEIFIDYTHAKHTDPVARAKHLAQWGIIEWLKEMNIYN